MDDSTSLDALLNNQGPQSAPPIIPMPSNNAPMYSGMTPSFKPTLPAMRWMASSASLYIAFFIAAVVVSLSTPRNLILQYIPSAYTSGGVVSIQGAAVLGAAAVVIAHLVNNFLASLFS